MVDCPDYQICELLLKLAYFCFQVRLSCGLDHTSIISSFLFFYCVQTSRLLFIQKIHFTSDCNQWHQVLKTAFTYYIQCRYLIFYKVFTCIQTMRDNPATNRSSQKLYSFPQLSIFVFQYSFFVLNSSQNLRNQFCWKRINFECRYNIWHREYRSLVLI